MAITPLVEPRISRGLRDLLPDQMAARQKMIDTIRGVYEVYGYSPLGTPAIEFTDVLTGSAAGAEATSSLFRVINPEKEALGLRFDLTVPLARVVAQYRDLPRPFRRYQVAQVWRPDKPDPGRYREFTQFDIDSVGAPSDLADVEIMAAMCDTLSALQVGRYRVRFSSRRLLEMLLLLAEVPQRWTAPAPPGGSPIECESADVFRVLDKLDKIGRDKLRMELQGGYKDESGTFVPGIGLPDATVERIDRFLDIRPDSRSGAVRDLRALFADVPGAATEVDTVEQISDRLGTLGYGDDRLQLDVSIARGLAYYTGPVFEANLVDAPQFGSVFGGGRYDGLVMRFLGEAVPATGASIGVDRLLAALIELKRIELRKSVADVLVAAFDPALADDNLQMAFELRRAGIRTELYLGDKGIGKQFKHADQLQIPLVIAVGGDEKAKGVVTIKDMTAGAAASQKAAGRSEWLQLRAGQVQVPRGDMVASVRTMLGHTSSADA